jgi:hypothetical protein
VVLLAACTALFASAYLRAGHQVPVLAVARSVPQGDVVRAGDLTVVRVSATGPLAPVAAVDAGHVVGRRAAVGLVPGALLTMAELTNGSEIPAGDAIVGVAVRAGQLPAEGVQAGETVDVVLTGQPGTPAVSAPSQATSAPSLPASVTGQSAGSALSLLTGGVLASDVLVTGTRTGSAIGSGSAANSGETDVSLLVPASAAPLLASASAAGQVALIAVPAAR